MSDDDTEERQKGRLRQKLKSTISHPAEHSTVEFPELKSRSKSDYGRKYGTQPASVPLNKIFIEVEDGFKQVNEDALKLKNPSDSQKTTKPSKENIFKNLAYKSHLYFHKFSLLCHGLLAGMAIMHCTNVFNLTPSLYEWTDFLQHYSHLANGYQSIFYFLNVICVISVLDRLDVSNKKWDAICTLYKQRNPIILTLLLYPISLVITISITNIDHMMWSYKFANKTTYLKDMSKLGIDITDKLTVWKWLTLVRSILVAGGWFLIAAQTEKDFFLQQLRENA